MIVVAGFNTAIDRHIHLDTLVPGAVQRARTVQAGPGGKGLHVAQTVVALGGRAHLVGLSDATHGAMIAGFLQARGVEWHPVEHAHELRQCLALHERDGRITEILEPGEPLDLTRRQSLLDNVRAVLDGSDVMVLSGSLPRGLPESTYAHLVRDAHARGIRCLVDASGAALRHALDAGPWLVKPNADEAAALWGRPVQGIDDAVACARWLHAQGVARAVVTLGSRGAVGFDGEQAWLATLPVQKAVNSVGSGDCFMAGLALSAERGLDLETALRHATACGVANAQDEETGYVRADRVDDLYAQVQVKQAGN